MAENGTTDSAITTTVTTADTGTADTTGQPTPPLVNADGELRENWRESVPEDIRGDKVFDRVSNFEGVMKSLSSAERAYGKDKILAPNEASSEAEWDAFYVAGGRPETAADYNLSRPEDFPEERWDNEKATRYMSLFHKIGLNQKQADAISNENNIDVLAQFAKKVQDDELAMTELKNGLYVDWGNAYEQRVHIGNVAVEQGVNGDEEFKTRLTQKFGNDPDFIRFTSNVGAKFVEHGAVDTSKLVSTTADIQAQIDEIVASKVYGADYAKHGFTKQQHKAAVEKAAALFRAKTPEVKTG